MNNLTFGRYSPYDTIVHRLDPRTKIMMMILLMVTIFLKIPTWSTTLILTGLILLFLIVIMLISRIRVRDLFKSLSAMWFMILLLIVVYVFIPNPNYNPDHIAFKIGTYGVNYDAFYQGGYIILRLVLMVMLTMILTSTTKPMDLTYALEWYMTPLKLVRFPVHIVAMTLSIALRFIPTLLDETNRIIKAQASRGVDYNSMNPFKKIRSLLSLIIPLFVSAINRSEELSNAMEARGYDPYGKRSKYRKLSFSWLDLAGFILVLLIFGGILTLRIMVACGISVDIIYWIFGAKPLF